MEVDFRVTTIVHRMHSTSNELFSRARKCCHTKLRLAFTDRRRVRVIEEGKSVVMFFALLPIEESDREDSEESIPVDDVEAE